MHALPDGWPRISPSIFYDDARAAIDWLCKAFGFEVRFVAETGSGAIAHSELVYGEGVIMVAQAGSRPQQLGPRRVGGCTQSLMVFVDDAEAHCSHARAAGAEIFQQVRESDYGPEYWSDRSYGALDCEGHQWWFVQRLKTGNPSWGSVRNRRDRSEHG